MTRLLPSRYILPGLVLTVLGLLIVLLAAGSPGRASAQSQALVSNLTEPENGSREVILHNRENTQQFTTGSNAAGYTLNSVKVDLLWSGFGGGAAPTVAVHADNSGRPGTKLATLAPPQALADGVNTFTHSGLGLAPSTSYFVVIETGQNPFSRIRMTRSADEDGAAGWSISNRASYRARGTTGAYFSVSSQSWRMAIDGIIRTAPPPGQVLVSNWRWEPSSGPGSLERGSFRDHDFAQEFTTGGRTLGYTLYSVELHLAVNLSNLANLKNNLGVAIHESSGGVPGDLVATLTKPVAASNGFNKYTHAGLDLSPSTSYFVVMDISTPTTAAVKDTVSDGETGAAGWTIGNSSLERKWDDTGEWETLSQTKRLRIKGEPKRSALTFPGDCSAAAITPGLYQGELTDDCPSLVRDQGVNARHVSFSLDQRQQVTLTLESPDFDTYLYLGSGTVLGSVDWTHMNDNIGYNDLGIDYSTDSRLSDTLDAGDYVAELTSLEANETGNFNLTLETSAPAAPPKPEPGPLPAPTGLTATASFVDDGRITIAADWNPVKGADFYRVRLTDGSGGQYSTKLSRGSSWGFFEAPGNIIRPGTTYTVEVSANDAPNKATAEVTTLRRPTGLTVTPDADDFEVLNVSWNLMPGATGYCLDWRTPPCAGSYGTTRYFTRQTASSQISGLEPGTEYEVRLGFQDGFSSDCTVRPAAKARGTTKSLVVGEIEGVVARAHPTQPTSLRLNWEAVSGATGYRVEYKEGTDPSAPFRVFSNSTARPTGASFHRITGLQADTEYTVRVTALRSGRSLGAGEGVGTTRVTFGGVQASLVVNHGDGLTVTWPALDGDYVYYVFYKRTGSSDTETRVTTRGVSPLRITGLTPNTEYTVRVQAQWVQVRRPNDNLTIASAGEATATGTTAPLSIQGVEVETVYASGSNYDLKVFWEDDSRAGRYRVEYRKGTDLNPYDPDGSRELDGSVTPSPPAFTASSTIARANLVTDGEKLKATHTVTGLEADTTYTVRVVALEGDSGTKEMGSGLNVGKTRAASETAKPVPSTLTVSANPAANSDTGLVASWNGVEGATKYRITWKEGVVGKPWSATVETTDTSYTITGLSPATNYTVYVAGIGADGYLKADDSADGTTTGGALTGLTVQTQTDADQLSVSWTWTPPAGTTAAYKIKWKTGSGYYGAVQEATTTPSTIMGLTGSTIYTVHVVAYNTDSMEELAKGVAVGITSAPPQSGEAVQPEPPQDQDPVGTAALAGLTVAAVSGQPTQLAVNWDEVQGAARYDVRWKTGAGDYGDAERASTNSYTIKGLSANTTYTVNVAALDGNNSLLAEATANGTTEPQTGQSTDPNEGGGTDEQQSAAAPAVSFVIYYDPDAGDAAVDRYNQAVALLDDAGIAYSVVRGDVQDDVDQLAGVTGSVIPRFFLGDPTDEDWVSETKVNNGGLRWLKEKVAELSGG